MNTKTILSVLAVFLLCVSAIPPMASAGGHGDTSEEPTHRVAISAEEQADGVDVTVIMVWQYGMDMRVEADMSGDGDGNVSQAEADQVNTDLGMMTLEDLQLEYESHIWAFSFSDSSMGGTAIVWDITAVATGLVGATEHVEGTVVTVTVTLVAGTTEPAELSFGPLDRNGTAEIPRFETAVEITAIDGGLCATSIDSDADAEKLTNPFSYRENDTFVTTVLFGKDDCAAEHADEDNDGVIDSLDECPGSPPGMTADEVGCDIDGPTHTDADSDGVPDSSDSCPGTATEAIVDENGCSADQTPEPEDDGEFNVTFSVDVGDSAAAVEHTCLNMTNTSSAADCMTAAGFTLPGGSTDAAGHPHHWTWSLQVNGVALVDQDAANLTLTSQSTFAWTADGCTGDCRTTTVHEATNTTTTVTASAGDCVWFNGHTPAFADGFDNNMSYRCFEAAGDYMSGDLKVTVAAASGTGNGTGTDPIDVKPDDSKDTPGFGLVAGITAVLGAALIAASRRED